MSAPASSPELSAFPPEFRNFFPLPLPIATGAAILARRQGPQTTSRKTGGKHTVERQGVAKVPKTLAQKSDICVDVCL